MLCGSSAIFLFDISESQLLEGQHEYLKILDLLSDSDPSLVLPNSTEVLQHAFAIRDEFQEVLRIRPGRQQTFPSYKGDKPTALIKLQVRPW